MQPNTIDDGGYKRRQLSYDPWNVLDDSCKYTHDWKRLKERNRTQEEFLVFVTGNLRKNRRQNYILKSCNWYGMAQTYDSNFLLKRSPFDDGYDVPQEPIMFHFPTTNPELRKEFSHVFNLANCGLIEGDLYGVPLRTLTEIDEHQGNGHGVNREELWINMTQQHTDKKPTKAFMYVADGDFFKEYTAYSVPKMQSCLSTHGKDGRVYYFSS